MKIQLLHVKTITVFLLLGLMNGIMTVAEAGDTSRPIEIINPSTLPSCLAADRIHLGQGYKPSMALLPNGELVLISFFWSGSRKAKDFHEYNLMWRSSDYGLTWSGPTRVKRSPGQDLIGREHWLTAIDNGTKCGILFSTCSILGFDTACPTGYNNKPPAFINRSTDGGHSWRQIQITGPYSRVNRNVLRMPNGDLVIGIGHYPGVGGYLWTSSDQGLSWSQSAQLRFEPYTDWQGVERKFMMLRPFMDETWLELNGVGEMVAYVRLKGPLFPINNNPPSGNDQFHRTITAKSTDGGLSWGDYEDISDYGQMYAHTTDLADGRKLLTFTQRSITEPLGLRAIISDDNGRIWNLNKDRIIIDQNTPSCWTSGGGFGNTIQLPDGSLISCYSYHDAKHGKGKYQTEVVRWSLSKIKQPKTE